MTILRPRCVLVRHGETAWSRDRLHTGRTDLALLPTGEAQAAALAPRLATWTFSLVLTSPLVRARRTAELAGLTGAEDDPDLLEWDYGEYEGRTTEAVRAERPDWDLFRDGVPGGEGLDEVAARADRVVARVRAQPGDAVVVAHAHVLRVLAVRWLGVPAAAARYLVVGPASVGVLGWEREQAVVESWNT